MPHITYDTLYALFSRNRKKRLLECGYSEENIKDVKSFLETIGSCPWEELFKTHVKNSNALVVRLMKALREQEKIIANLQNSEDKHGYCRSISPNGRVCILASPHEGCEHESMGLPDGNFEVWED